MIYQKNDLLKIIQWYDQHLQVNIVEIWIAAFFVLYKYAPRYVHKQESRRDIVGSPPVDIFYYYRKGGELEFELEETNDEYANGRPHGTTWRVV